MKLKYYLRGFGLGIILTMVIMMIVTHSSRVELSNADIIDKAEKLGMQMVEETKKPEKQPEKNPEILPEKEPEVVPEVVPEVPEKEPISVVENVSIVVNKGDSSDGIAAKLQNAGLVASAKVFNQFLIENKYDGILLTGTFTIPKGSTADEIAKILTKK